MAYLIYEGKKHILTNLKNIDKRCSCNSDHYTYIINPIQVMLKEGKEPTLFKTTTKEPYSNTKYLSRAISFKGCICELDKISENYKIYGALRPTQYNFITKIVYKEEGKLNIVGGHVSYQQESKWAGR